MLEVVGHQRFGTAPAIWFGVMQTCRGLLLQLVAQDIQVAARIEVQPRAQTHEKFFGLAQPIRRGRTRHAASIAAQFQDGPRGPDVAQRARALFHVGLELIERVVELAVALVGQQHESLENLRMPVAARRLTHRIEAVRQLAIAGQCPQIHERQQKFRIVGFEPIKVGQLPHVVPDREPQIP